MKCHLIRWNPNTSSYKLEDFRSDFLSSKYMDGLDDFSWDLKNKESIENGDFWIILKVGTDKNGIVALGYFIDRSEFGWDDEDENNSDPFMEVLCMFNIDDYDYLSIPKLKTVCPNFDWNKDTNDNEIVTIEYTKQFFPLIANIFTDTHGITPFYSYSADNHPDIDNEIESCAFAFCPDYKYEIVPWDYYVNQFKDEKPWIREKYRFTKTSIMILKSCIGTILRKYWNYGDKNVSRGTDFIFYNYSSFSIISKINEERKGALSAFTVVPQEFEFFSKIFVKDLQEQEVNELVKDVLIYTDKFFIKDIRNNTHQIQIDIGIKFILKNSELLIEKNTYESNFVYTDFYQLNNSPSFSIPLNNDFKLDDDCMIESVQRIETSLNTEKEKLIDERNFISTKSE